LSMNRRYLRTVQILSYSHFVLSASTTYEPSDMRAACRNNAVPETLASSSPDCWPNFIPVPSAQTLPSGTVAPPATFFRSTILTASTSLTSSSSSLLKLSCSGVPSLGGINADNRWRWAKVVGDMVGVGYEDKSAFTDQVGFVGMPQESVSTIRVDFRRILD
jgi:hypothetical protein